VAQAPDRAQPPVTATSRTTADSNHRRDRAPRPPRRPHPQVRPNCRVTATPLLAPFTASIRSALSWIITSISGGASRARWRARSRSSSTATAATDPGASMSCGRGSRSAAGARRPPSRWSRTSACPASCAGCPDGATAPRPLQRILRLRRFVALAEATPAPDLARAAVEVGYSDQPHLTHGCAELSASRRSCCWPRAPAPTRARLRRGYSAARPAGAGRAGATVSGA
jgi:hypothetical protein